MRRGIRRTGRFGATTSAACLAATSLTGLGLGSSAVAQDDEEAAAREPLPATVESLAVMDTLGEPAPPSDDIEVFERVYFDVYNPVTASDMVSRVPGFSIAGGGGGGFGNFNGGGGRRGFGTNDANVLINGERPSSKTSINEQLGRIPAQSVDHLELLRGAALADADVRGQTQVVNVVLLPGTSVGAVTTYNAEVSTNRSHELGYNVQATRSFRIRDADVTLDARLPSNPEAGRQTETVVDADGATTLVRHEGDDRENRQLRLNGTVSWEASQRDAFNANLSFTPREGEQRNYSYVVDADGAPIRSEFTESEEKDSWEFELGGDWERQLTTSTSFKAIGLYTERTGTNETREDAYLPDAFDATTVLLSESTAGERILRGEYTWRANGSHTVETGLEAAFNFRDSFLDLQFAGELDNPLVSIFTDDVRVEELRGEAYVSDVWSVSPKLSLESGFTFEASRISQIRDEGDPYEREFTYPKPNMTATYALTDDDQLRFSVTRDVNQLDFGDFASSVSLGDDRQEAGNQELVPEQTWETRLQWERRFAARGVVTIEAYYDSVEDKQDRVPVPVPIDGVEFDLDDPSTYTVVDGAGNIGEGTRMGVRVDTTVPLDFIGVPGAELRMRGRRQESEITDPVTGATRSFSGNNDWDYNIDFRQDVPGQEFAWGAGIGRDALRQVYRVTETQEFGPGAAFIDVYAETTRFMGVTIRFQVGNIGDNTFVRRRYMYRDFSVDPIEGDARTRDLGPPDLVEERRRKMGPFYSLRVSGRF